MKLDESILVRCAIEASQTAWSPYSRFQVGAALLGEDGQIYTGCNVESAAFTPGCCAERTALFKAISQGQRTFTALAVYGHPQDEPARSLTAPCGACRQMLTEFCAAEFPVILVKSETEYRTVSLGELLPYAFGAKDWHSDGNESPSV